MALIRGLPEAIEALRDQAWQRDEESRIEDRAAAESFIKKVGFCNALTDNRHVGPSLYVAVCGRRDAHLPRNVQKDPECRLAWNIKDEVIRTGRVYYAKLARARTMFVAAGLVPYFNAIWGVPRSRESKILSEPAQAVLKVLRREWEMGTRDLRAASAVPSRHPFNKAIDELQRTFKVIPSDVVYEPSFTYIWSLAEARFPAELRQKVARETALREIARAYLSGAKLTLAGELARATGLSRADAGLGNWALVDEGFAKRFGPGIYCLAELWSLVDVELKKASA